MLVDTDRLRRVSAPESREPTRPANTFTGDIGSGGGGERRLSGKRPNRKLSCLNKEIVVHVRARALSAHCVVPLASVRVSTSGSVCLQLCDLTCLGVVRGRVMWFHVFHELCTAECDAKRRDRVSTSRGAVSGPLHCALGIMPLVRLHRLCTCAVCALAPFVHLRRLRTYAVHTLVPDSPSKRPCLP